jgi:hypothetical protein
MWVGKVVFAGCSYTAGSGCRDIESGGIKYECKDDPNLWVNLCCNNIPDLQNLKLCNIGKVGASNTEIFESVVENIAVHSSDIKVLFCQWTAMPRYNWNIGFELWDTLESLQNDSKNNHNLTNGETYTAEYVNDVKNRLRTMHHLHWEILKVVKYSNLILKLGKKLNINKIFFINGICPWDNNYFTYLNHVTTKPEDYTEFTKNDILNIKHRDDSDIFKLYNLAHQHYISAGGINPTTWINLYNSFHHNRIDYNFDLNHPGIKSNQIYFQLVKNFLAA